MCVCVCVCVCLWLCVWLCVCGCVCVCFLPEMDSGCCSSSLLCRLHEPAALGHSYPDEKQKPVRIKATEGF